MNYVLAAWISCAAILAAYTGRTLRRERLLRRSLVPRSPEVLGSSPVLGSPREDKDGPKWR